MKKSENFKKQYRFLNRDGTNNIIKPKTYGFFEDVYHRTMGLSWFQFFLILTVLYFAINFIFALLYFSIGVDGLTGVRSVSQNLNFLSECFFFSIQTFSTIGYGSVSPANLLTNTVVSFQALLGLLSVGLMSGLFFSRFSTPTARVAHSEVALITKHENQNVFMFRMANARMNQMIEASVTVMIAIDTTTPEGITLRKLIDLPVLRSKTPAFALSWTVIHVIDDQSPLYKKSILDLENNNAEIFVLVSGHDESFHQLVFSRYSYTANEIVLDRQYKDMLIREGHMLRINIDDISKLK